MKNSILTLLVSFCAIIILSLATIQVSSHHTIPDWGNTGAPSETTCGKSTCHNNSPNSGPGTLTVSFDHSSYKPDSTYLVTVTTSESGMPRFGFEATVLDGSNVKAGTLAVINATNTSFNFNFQNRAYVGHKSASSNNTWTFNWTAPSTNIGDVTLYVASNCANGNSNATGDHIYTTSLVFQPDLSNAISGVSDAGSFLTVQNPVTEKIFINFKNAETGNTSLRLFDINGHAITTLLNENEIAGTHQIALDKPAVSGLYFIEFNNGTSREIKKVIVL